MTDTPGSEPPDRAAPVGPAKKKAPSPKLGKIVSALTFVLLAFLTQIVLRRALAPGEFGTLNTLLGLCSILAAPFLMLALLLRRGVKPSEVGPLLNRAAPAWGIACIVLLFILLPALNLPRVSLHFYMLLAVGATILAICGRPALTAARWGAMLGVSAAVMRLLVSAWAGRDWPVAESGLGGFVLGAVLAGLPALRDQPAPRPFAIIWGTLRPHLVRGLAALSLGGAIALFINADRIVAQLAFTARDAEFIDYARFDEYQSAGLLARGVLAGLLPLLFLLYPQRAALAKTTSASLRWLWIYLGVLLAASIALAFCGGLEQLLFGGLPDVFLPGFAGAVFMLGLVQAVGIFALASRRHVECFLLAACSLGYTAFLFIADNPQVLTTCMAGGALVSLALVLLVGVIRYARSHP